MRDAQRRATNVPVVIQRADKNVKYESVVKVMDTLQKSGVRRVGLRSVRAAEIPMAPAGRRRRRPSPRRQRPGAALLAPAMAARRRLVLAFGVVDRRTHAGPTVSRVWVQHCRQKPRPRRGTARAPPPSATATGPAEVRSPARARDPKIAIERERRAREEKRRPNARQKRPRAKPKRRRSAKPKRRSRGVEEEGRNRPAAKLREEQMQRHAGHAAATRHQLGR